MALIVAINGMAFAPKETAAVAVPDSHEEVFHCLRSDSTDWQAAWAVAVNREIAAAVVAVIVGVATLVAARQVQIFPTTTTIAGRCAARI